MALRLRRAPWSGLQLHGFYDDTPGLAGTSIDGVPVIGSIESLRGDLDRGHLDQVWIALPLRAEERIRRLVIELRGYAVQVRYVPDIFGFQLLRHSFSEVAGMPVIGLTDTPLEGLQRVLKTPICLDESITSVEKAELTKVLAAGSPHERRVAAEALGRVGYLGPDFRPAWPGARIGGTAVTVLCWPGDNLMIHAAVEQCQAGDLLVVTTPQPAAQRVAARTADVAEKTGMRVAGVVEHLVAGRGAGVDTGDVAELVQLTRRLHEPVLAVVSEHAVGSKSFLAVAGLAEEHRLGAQVATDLRARCRRRSSARP